MSSGASLMTAPKPSAWICHFLQLGCFWGFYYDGPRRQWVIGCTWRGMCGLYTVGLEWTRYIRKWLKKVTKKWASNMQSNKPKEFFSSSLVGLGGVPVRGRSGQQGWVVVSLRRGSKILARAGSVFDMVLLFLSFAPLALVEFPSSPALLHGLSPLLLLSVPCSSTSGSGNDNV